MEKKPKTTANAKDVFGRKKGQGAQLPVSDLNQTAELPAEVTPAVDGDAGFDDGKKYLSEADVLKIQMNHLKLKLISLTKENADLRVKLEEKDTVMLQMRTRDELERLKANAQAFRKKIEQAETEEKAQLERNREELRLIGEKHGVVGTGFGYHPDTLELVTD